jgi:hypothetical protein
MWRTVRTGWKRLVLAVGLSVLAISAAPAVMGPAYEQLQPRLGPMTLFLVEVLYALFIDFPLTALYVVLATVWAGPARNPVRSALAFVATFFALILLVIAAAPLSDLLAYWALADTFPVAVAEARQALGQTTTALLLTLFVAFDVVLCAAGGLVGHLFTVRDLPSQPPKPRKL